MFTASAATPTNARRLRKHAGQIGLDAAEMSCCAVVSAFATSTRYRVAAHYCDRTLGPLPAAITFGAMESAVVLDGFLGEPDLRPERGGPAARGSARRLGREPCIRGESRKSPFIRSTANSSGASWTVAVSAADRPQTRAETRSARSSRPPVPGRRR